MIVPALLPIYFYSTQTTKDNGAAGTTRIKLKSSRIGWIYYSFDSKGNRTANQSGWNTVTGLQWNNF